MTETSGPRVSVIAFSVLFDFVRISSFGFLITSIDFPRLLSPPLGWGHVLPVDDYLADPECQSEAHAAGHYPAQPDSGFPAFLAQPVLRTAVVVESSRAQGHGSRPAMAEDQRSDDRQKCEFASHE
jgi:hypothetical protein